MPEQNENPGFLTSLKDRFLQGWGFGGEKKNQTTKDFILPNNSTTSDMLQGLTSAIEPEGRAAYDAMVGNKDFMASASKAGALRVTSSGALDVGAMIEHARSYEVNDKEGNATKPMAGNAETLAQSFDGRDSYTVDVGEENLDSLNEKSKTSSYSNLIPLLGLAPLLATGLSFGGVLVASIAVMALFLFKDQIASFVPGLGASVDMAAPSATPGTVDGQRPSPAEFKAPEIENTRVMSVAGYETKRKDGDEKNPLMQTGMVTLGTMEVDGAEQLLIGEFEADMDGKGHITRIIRLNEHGEKMIVSKESLGTNALPTLEISMDIDNQNAGYTARANADEVKAFLAQTNIEPGNPRDAETTQIDQSVIDVLRNGQNAEITVTPPTLTPAISTLSNSKQFSTLSLTFPDSSRGEQNLIDLGTIQTEEHSYRMVGVEGDRGGNREIAGMMFVRDDMKVMKAMSASHHFEDKDGTVQPLTGIQFTQVDGTNTIRFDDPEKAFAQIQRAGSDRFREDLLHEIPADDLPIRDMSNVVRKMVREQELREQKALQIEQEKEVAAAEAAAKQSGKSAMLGGTVDTYTTGEGNTAGRINLGTVSHGDKNYTVVGTYVRDLIETENDVEINSVFLVDDQNNLIKIETNENIDIKLNSSLTVSTSRSLDNNRDTVQLNREAVDNAVSDVSDQLQGAELEALNQFDGAYDIRNNSLKPVEKSKQPSPGEGASMKPLDPNMQAALDAFSRGQGNLGDAAGAGLPNNLQGDFAIQQDSRYIS